MTSPAPTPEDTLRTRLPGAVAQRLQSLRVVEGRAILVLDAQGLDAAERDALEAVTQEALKGANGVNEVRVALMAQREPGQPAPKPTPQPAPASPAKAAPTPAPVTQSPVILAVGSGKGGVGKSTLAVNLAVALARSGRKVGLVDADIYGPSQARLLGTEGQRAVAHDGKLVPVQSPVGVPVLSMAHLTEEGQAIAWRGPKIAGALIQLVEAHWGGAEVLVIDLPPGTGDIQLTMLQRFKPAGAVIVSTPQDLALMDSARAVELFRQGGVPLVGVVENMAGYACPHCGEVSDPFGSGGAEAAAAKIGVPFLGRIPLHMSIRVEGDAGTPTAAGDSPQAQAFAGLAAQVGAWLDTHAKAPSASATAHKGQTA